MSWNWDHLRFFLALAEHGTLSAAARVLDVSHSTVLRRIRQIESEINTQLFEHTHSGYHLTQAGQTLFIEAKKMQGTMSALSREISGVPDQMNGEVIITTTDTIARHILPKLMRKLTGAFPEIRFSVYMANRLSDMDNRNVDIAIRTCKEPPDELLGRKVGEIAFAAVASETYVKEHTLSGFPKSLAEHKVIMLDESYSAAPFYQWLNSKIDHTTNITTVNNFLCAAALAREGMGITVVPAYLQRKEKELVELALHEEISKNDLWVLSHAESRNTKRVRTVCRFFYDELPKALNANA